MSGSVIGGLVVPGLPHPLLAPDQNPGWRSLHNSFIKLRGVIEELRPDLLLLYSTQWASIIGHQIQADPNPSWTLVDHDFYQLGTLRYSLRIDSEFAHAYEAAARGRGLTARTVNYRGFPVDTGSVVALQLLDPDNSIPACVVSCNMYADRAETIVLGKAAADAVRNSGRRCLAVAVTSLSNRKWTHQIEPIDDRIHSQKDDEWNQKLLELLSKGRLEDVSQLARQFTAQAYGDNKLKALWWLAACVGQNNGYMGEVHDYQAVWGTGAALVSLIPEPVSGADLEYDEDDVENYQGDRSVLSLTS